jgi:hypothetical protein
VRSDPSVRIFQITPELVNAIQAPSGETLPPALPALRHFLLSRLGCAIMGYHLEARMTDMLIRDVPDDVIAAVDARASRLGLSRSEYVRRRLAQDAAAGAAVTTRDLARFAETFADLDDPAVMSRAWR